MTTKDLRDRMEPADNWPDDLPIVISYYHEGKQLYLTLDHVHRLVTCSQPLPGVPAGNLYCLIAVK